MSLRLRRRRRQLEIFSAPTTRTRKTQARYNCPRAKNYENIKTIEKPREKTRDLMLSASRRHKYPSSLTAARRRSTDHAAVSGSRLQRLDCVSM